MSRSPAPSTDRAETELDGRGITDWHSHIWLPGQLGPEFGKQLDEHYAHVPSESGSPEHHRRMMAESGVEQAVVIGLTSDHLGMDIPNEFVGDYVASDPGRLVGFSSVDPNRADAPAELRYALGEIGLRGVKLAPPYQDFHPHSEEAYRVYEVAAEHGAVILFHQGAVTHRRGVLEVAQPILLDRVARDFPELKIIVAHVGQPWFVEVVSMMRKHRNLYTDVSARCQRPAQLAKILEAVLDYDLQDRLLFGSDFPVFDPRAHASSFLSVAEESGDERLDGALVRDVLFNRPLSLLGLE
ncbi:amidohydrolase family protein [Leucobacter soli]|uniref:Amidohydrolase-related domain-containing protein n=1 Tax=Leucobacter soli TaxID=2812850 RepID=A0A916NMF9_9MICO|nr:amidohydrolase family protein [Leucobacter soli]CAG7605249.1 hypothetical protein LEUCIP111803_00811 [Leucobacter soli]